MIRKIACLLAVVLAASSFAACNKTGDNKPTVETGDIIETEDPDNTEPDQVLASDALVPETSAEEEVDSRIMDAFCEYAEKNFVGEVEILYKGVDYGDKSDLYYGEDFILPPPERVASYNYSIDTDSRILFFEAQVFEYKNAGDACGAFGSFEDAFTNIVISKNGNNDFDISTLAEDSYYFNGKNEGYICSCIKGKEMITKFIENKMNISDINELLNDRAEYLSFDPTKIDYLDSIGCYLKDNCIILIYAQDLVINTEAVLDIDANSMLKICDTLGVKNPMTSGADFDVALSLSDRYGKMSIFFHNLMVSIVDAEINSYLNNN